MFRRFIPVAVIALIFAVAGSNALAQCGCSSTPVYTPVAPSYTSYYAAPVDYAPVAYTSYYAPPVAYAPAPFVSYYAPTVPYTTYYAPSVSYAAYYAPGVAYAPVVAPYRAYYGVPGRSMFGAPRIYVPGEPVRNTLKAVTP